MTRLRFPPRLSTLVISGAIGAAALLQSATADAGRVRFSGGAHVSGSVRIRGPGVSIRHGRATYRRSFRPWHRGWYGGSVWVGGYYYPRPYYYYYPEHVPSYYAPAYYYPVQPSAAPGVVAAAPAPRPRMPTFGVGVSAGGVFQSDSGFSEDSQQSSDLSVLGRIRITPGLLIEGEFGKTAYKDDLRVDRRLGGSLIWEIGAENRFAPYLLGGIGVNQVEVEDSFTTTQQFGEIGVGLRLALSRNLHLAADVRAGTRKAVDSDDEVFLDREYPAYPIDTIDDSEEYTRARLAAILTF